MLPPVAAKRMVQSNRQPRRQIFYSSRPGQAASRSFVSASIASRRLYLASRSDCVIEPTLIQPTFVTHLPKELVPLARLAPEDPTTVEVFECCMNGQEIAPAYTEQNDPIEQRERLEHQAGGEQQKLDEDFLVALEHGMPPAGGMGMGIDRLCMMVLGQESIRDNATFHYHRLCFRFTR